jgi:hypothetical protein
VSARVDSARLPEEAARQLLEALVLLRDGIGENALDVRPQFLLTETISRSDLGAVGIAGVGAIDQRAGGGLIVARIVARGEVIDGIRRAGIFFGEGAGHGWDNQPKSTKVNESQRKSTKVNGRSVVPIIADHPPPPAPQAPQAHT